MNARALLYASLLAAVAAAQTGCDRNPAQPPRPATTTEGSGAAAGGTGLSAGIQPAPVDRPAASDRPGMPAIGAVEAGQASGGAARGGAPEPSGGGDGAASSPSAGASR